MSYRSFRAVLLAACLIAGPVAGARASVTLVSGPTSTPGLSIPSIPRPPFNGLGDAPAGAQFLDPVLSTFEDSVYRAGPVLLYDPVTGAATVEAPPMLGPADGFGQRSLYSPYSVTLLFDTPVPVGTPLPSGTLYEMSYEGTGPAFTPMGPDVAGLESEVGHSHVMVHLGALNSFGGADLAFDDWLLPDLDPEMFDTPPSELADGFLRLSAASPLNSVLPPVGAVVQYRYESGLLGAPLEMDLMASITIIPEPITRALAPWVFLAIMLVRLRRRKDR